MDQETVDKVLLLEEFIDQYYYEEVPLQDKRDGLYKGLVESLGDTYSEYYTAAEYQDMVEQMSGTFYGVGAYVQEDTERGYCVFSGIIKGTPAEEAGLLSGDLIYEVDGESMYGLKLSEVVSKVKGPEGTVVHLTIYREGEDDYLEFDVTRAQIDVPTVSYEMTEDKIGYLELTEFDDISTEQFEEALEDLKSQGMKGLILDLRDNPGGNVTTVTAIANMLLPEGLVFYQEDKYGRVTEYPCSGSDFDYPLVVLINEYSASASEILAGAVQDAGIGTLVGTTTFGKGIVQTLFSLRDGTAIKVTVADYYTRAGRYIHGVGIDPDVEVKFDNEAYKEDGTDTQFEKALEIMREQIGR